MSSDTKSPRMKFGEPPTPRGPAYDWAYIAKRLKRRPGEWALVFEKDRVSLVNAIKAGSISALREEDGFITRTENNKRLKPRICDLWMCYDPDKDQRKAGG